MVKPYTWEDIKKVLSSHLKTTKHILTFGTIGSKNIENDLDLIVTKKPDSSSKDFYQELNGIFKFLDGYLNTLGSKSIIFYTMQEEQFLRYLNSYEKNDLGIHLMVYFSFPQIKIDWAGAHNVDYKKLFLTDYDCIHGEGEDLFYESFQRSNKFDSTYNFLFMQNKSRYYPAEFRLMYAKKIIDYISRKRLGIEPIIVNNVNQIEKKFYELCDKLDELEKKESQNI